MKNKTKNESRVASTDNNIDKNNINELIVKSSIPKTIHYIWVGLKTQSETIKKCIQSWENNLSEFNIKLWNENNFPINDFAFTKNAYQNKKYAYVADYIRLYALYHEGGIYLDTDMYVLKDFNFLNTGAALLLGKEDDTYISAGMIGSSQKHKYIKMLLDYYDNNTVTLEPIPKIMTKVFENYKKCPDYKSSNILIFDPIYFYPFDQNNIKIFFKNNFQNAPSESYAVHLWDYSWGHPLNKFIKKIGLYKILKKITERIGIKNIIKKILKME